MATKPSPSATPSTDRSDPKPEIDLHSALRSTLRAWLALRDIALWGFCGGTDFEDSGVYLERIDAESFFRPATEMNHLQTAALEIASRINARNLTPQQIIAVEMRALLSTESARFSLQLDSIPDSF